MSFEINKNKSGKLSSPIEQDLVFLGEVEFAGSEVSIYTKLNLIDVDLLGHFVFDGYADDSANWEHSGYHNFESYVHFQKQVVFNAGVVFNGSEGDAVHFATAVDFSHSAIFYGGAELVGQSYANNLNINGRLNFAENAAIEGSIQDYSAGKHYGTHEFLEEVHFNGDTYLYYVEFGNEAVFNELVTFNEGVNFYTNTNMFSDLNIQGDIHMNGYNLNNLIYISFNEDTSLVTPTAGTMAQSKLAVLKAADGTTSLKFLKRTGNGTSYSWITIA